jgi:RNA polymerase primary sigma factor
MKKQDMVDSLLALGVRRGMLTWQELNDAFPAESFPLDELERFLRLLEDLGVKVVDSVQMRRRKISHAWRSRQEH